MDKFIKHKELGDLIIYLLEEALIYGNTFQRLPERDFSPYENGVAAR